MQAPQFTHADFSISIVRGKSVMAPVGQASTHRRHFEYVFRSGMQRRLSRTVWSWTSASLISMSFEKSGMAVSFRTLVFLARRFSWRRVEAVSCGQGALCPCFAGDVAVTRLYLPLALPRACFRPPPISKVSRSRCLPVAQAPRACSHSQSSRPWGRSPVRAPGGILPR